MMLPIDEILAISLTLYYSAAILIPIEILFENCIKFDIV